MRLRQIAAARCILWHYTDHRDHEVVRIGGRSYCRPVAWIYYGLRAWGDMRKEKPRPAATAAGLDEKPCLSPVGVCDRIHDVCYAPLRANWRQSGTGGRETRIRPTPQRTRGLRKPAPANDFALRAAPAVGGTGSAHAVGFCRLAEDGSGGRACWAPGRGCALEPLNCSHRHRGWSEALVPDHRAPLGARASASRPQAAGDDVRACKAAGRGLRCSSRVEVDNCRIHGEDDTETTLGIIT